jgi:hypothetical protein
MTSAMSSGWVAQDFVCMLHWRCHCDFICMLHMMVQHRLHAPVSGTLRYVHTMGQGTNYSSPSRGAQQPSWDDLGTQAKSPQSAASGSSQDSEQAQAEDIDAMRSRSAEMAWGNGAEAERAGSNGGSGSSGSKANDGIANVSLDQLQAELARRRAAKS